MQPNVANRGVPEQDEALVGGARTRKPWTTPRIIVSEVAPTQSGTFSGPEPIAPSFWTIS